MASKRFPWMWMVVLCLLSCKSGVRTTDAASQARALVADQRVDGRLDTQTPHDVVVEMVAGQHVAFLVEQRGIDLQLVLRDDAGIQLLDEASVVGTIGTERLDFVAPTTGRYRLRIKASDAGAQRGEYTLSLRGPKAATAVDRKRAQAQVITVRARKSARDAGDKLAGSVAEWQSALQLWTELDDVYRQAEATGGLARSFLLLGQLEKSVEQRERALVLFEKVGDRHGQAMSLYGLGLLHSMRGDIETSSRTYQQSIVHSRAVGDTRTEAKALHNMGANHQDLDELSLALEAYAKAQQRFLSIGDEGEYTHLARGSIYDILGKKKEARFHFEKARRSLHQRRMIWDEATAISRIASFTLRRDNDPKRAQALFESALALHRKAGDGAGEAATLTELGLVRQRLGVGECEDHQKAVMLQKKLGSLLAQARALRARGACLLLQGHTKDAHSDLDQAGRLARTVGNRSLQATTLLSLARLHEKNNDLTAARAAMASAVSLIEDVRSRVNEQEFRTTFSERVRGFYDESITLLMQEPRTSHDVERAFVLSENSRARTLLETLRLSGTQLGSHTAADLLTDERKRARRLKLAEHRHQAALLRSANDSELIRSRQLVAGALADYRAVQAKVRKTVPSYAALTQPVPLKLAALQRALPQRTALVEYSLGEPHSTLWRITRSDIKAFVLPARTQIERKVRALLSALTARNLNLAGETPAARAARIARADKDYATHASGLAEMVLWPALQTSRVQRLLVVPDGALHYVPFAALPAQSSSPEPLTVSHEVVTLPSAAVLLALRARPRDNKVTQQLAIVADPVFDAQDPRVVTETTTTATSTPYLPRLRFSRKEADAIKNVATSANKVAFVAVDFHAVRELFTTNALARHHTIHIAAHGVIDSLQPERSSIVLSRVHGNGKPRDGRLRLQDIYNLRLGAELVVLSACETALGEEIRGEGIVGLTRGFLYAGARRVVASLWRIGDRSTSILMERFYRAMLVDQLSPAAALRKAQVSMLREKRWSAPYYWAPFVLQGEFL